MNRRLATLPLILLMTACSAGGASPSVQPSPRSSPTPAPVPTGRILFSRLSADEVEDFVTINTDGTNEDALFERQGCGCGRLSPSGRQVWTMGPTGHDTFSFMTMGLDGSDPTVFDPPIETLNLGPAAASPNGEWLAFDGWDETDPSRNGLYLGSGDLADLHLVMPNPEGVIRTEPFGVTPDGSQVVFFAENGARGDVPHAGDLFVVNADGSGLRQLNPPGTFHAWVGLDAGSMSPDGRSVAFGVDDAIFIVDLDGGEARQITERSGFVWAVSWSPTGEWITYTRLDGSTSVIELVSPDGTSQRRITAADASEEAEAAVWSPDGDYLLVQRGPDGQRDLWIIDLDGAVIGQVTHEPSAYGMYGWAPFLEK